MILTMNYLTLYDSVQYQLLKSAHLHKKRERVLSFFVEMRPLRVRIPFILRGAYPPENPLSLAELFA